MEASSQEPILTLADDVEEDIAAFRQRARERLEVRRGRLVELQKQILDQSRSLAGDLENDRIRLSAEQTALAAQRAEIEQHLNQLEALRSELCSDRSEWEGQQAHVFERQENLLTALAEQHDRLETVRVELAAREQVFHEQRLQFEHEQAAFYSLQLQQAEREDQLDTKDREISAGQAALDSRRAALAAEEESLQQQLAELERLREQCNVRQHELKALEAKTQHQRKQIAAQLRQHKSQTLTNARSEVERLREQIELFQQQQSETRTALERKEEELKRLQQESQRADQNTIDAISLRKQIEELQRERDGLLTKLQTARTPDVADDSSNSAELEDLRRRYEATTSEIRALKQSNRDLEARLAKQQTGRPAPSTAGSSSSGAMDWEAQKQRLLAQLENDGEPADHEQKRERLRIEEVIRVTDRAIQEKEQELRELRQLLEDQSSNIGDVAVGASAIAAMLDSDELIREERESLKQLQAQWREKLRQAELDISVERAKVARERTELDEKVEQFEKQRAKLEQELREGAADPAKKPNKRKWMDRLGIKNDDA